MSVYVDDMEAPYRRMRMCHMLADTEEELHAMAKRIGVARRWFQTGGSGDHYDICLSMKAKALCLGAVAVTWRQAGLMNGCRRMGAGLGAPETAHTRYMELRAAKALPPSCPAVVPPGPILDLMHGPDDASFND